MSLAGLKSLLSSVAELLKSNPTESTQPTDWLDIFKKNKADNKLTTDISYNDLAIKAVTNHFVESWNANKPITAAASVKLYSTDPKTSQTYTPKAVIIPLKEGQKSAIHEELSRRTVQATLEQNGIHPLNLEMEELMSLPSYQNLDMNGYYGKDWKEYHDLPGSMPAPGKFKDVNGREVFGYRMALAPQWQAGVVGDYKQIKGELEKPENINRKAVVDMKMTERLQEMVKIAWEKGYISQEVKNQLGSLTAKELAGAFAIGGVIGIIGTTEAGAAALGPVGGAIALAYTAKQMLEFDHIADGCARATNRQQLDKPAKEFGEFLGSLSKDGVLALVGTAGGITAPRVMPRVEEALTSKVGNVKEILKEGLPKLEESRPATPNGAPVETTNIKPTNGKIPLERMQEPLEMRRLGNESFTKPVNFPSAKNVKIDMDEVISGHKVGGSRLNAGNRKSLFPKDWSKEKIETAVREAYKNADTVLRRQITPEGHEKLFLEGSSRGWRIRFWYNKTTQQIETAFPNRADIK